MNDYLKMYYNSALNLKLPVNYLPEIDGLEIALGKQSYFFIQKCTPLNTGSSIFINLQKQRTNFIIEEHHFKTPQSVMVSKEQFSQQTHHDIIAELTMPVLIKPVLTTQSYPNILIKEIKTLDSQLKDAFNHHEFLLIQEAHNELKKYRVLILKTSVIGVLELNQNDEPIMAYKNEIHVQNAKLLIQAAKTLSLEWVCFDVLCQNINVPFKNNPWFITDTYSTPDITPFEKPSHGIKNNVSRKVLLHLIYRHPLSYLYYRIKKAFFSNKENAYE
jgi:hypothetical protein